MVKVMDAAAMPGQATTGYPDPFHKEVAGRVYRRLGDEGGLTQFGFNHVTLKPGAWSSQRHWHKLEDEFVYVLEGEPTLVTDEGETVLRAGQAVAFKAGVPDGHHLVNRTDRDAVFLVAGSKMEGEEAYYPDVDLHLPPGGGFTRKDGAPYPKRG